MLSDEHGHVPPGVVAAQAAKGLKFKDKFARGGTKVGWAMARNLAARHPINNKDIIRMASYFARHKVDKAAQDFGNEDKPSKGYIAWLLWGGDEGYEWALGVRQKINADIKNRKKK